MRRFLRILLLVAALLPSGRSWAAADQPGVKFIVITDIHIGRYDAARKVSNSLEVITKRADGAQALFVTGDLTDQGHQEQYEQMKAIFDKHVPQSLPCYYVLGNHDRLNDKNIKGSRFSRTFGQPADTMVVIGGYYFIMLSMRNPGDDDIYDRNFLSRSLAKADEANEADPAKPIFLMYHVPAEGTVYGSFEIGGKDSWGTDAVSDILSNYPQVFAFSGHSHFPLRDERSIHHGGFTSVNAGTSSYSEYERGKSEGIHPSGYQEVSEGLIVEVKPDGEVAITRYDTTRDEEILKPWIVRPPYAGMPQINRRDARPAFPKRAGINIDDLGDDGVQISFPQAWAGTSDTHHYRIELIDSGDRNKPEQLITVFSGFHLGSAMPAEIEWKIGNISADKKYRISVTAVDSFGNYSKRLMSGRFKQARGDT